MKSFVTVLAMLVAIPAFAHLELGTYKGKTADGRECTFEVKSVSFVRDLKHPLNERVEILVDGETYTLQHLPRVNAETGDVLFERDLLTGAAGYAGGALAAVLKMEHSTDRDGPISLTLLNHSYKYKSKASSFCGDLAHQN